MEKVKLFSEQFAEKEAEVSTRKRFPDLDAYHKALNEYFSFLVEQLQGATGHMPLKELRSPEHYEKMKKYPADLPRHIFKISEYNSVKYGKAWVVFASSSGHYEELDSAFIVIEEHAELKIAKFLLYTHYTESGDKDAPYRWDDMQGYSDLNFSSLEGPVNIERYKEPEDGGEALYHQEI